MKLGGSLQRRRRGVRHASDRDAEGEGLGRWVSRYGGRIWALGVGVIVAGWLVGYLAATRVVFPAPPPPGDLYEVPDLSGLDLNTARERIEGMGLELAEVDSVPHPSLPRSLVLGQSPLPGQLAIPDSPVRLTVSLGPERRAIPDVTGLLADRARIMLEASGFVVTVDSTESEEPRGRVVDVRPEPGQEVALPAEVEVVVSTGPPLVVMPLVLGLPREEAVAMLDSLGLVVSDVEEVFRFGRDQGIVVEQEPAADTELRRGSEVRLSVGRDGGDGEQ